MLRITTPSLPARVAILTLILAAATSCVAGPASIRVGELPGHWYIDVKA
jgi:hypothetical protein